MLIYIADIDGKNIGTSVNPCGTPFFRRQRQVHCPSLVFLLISVTAIGGRTKCEMRFLSGQLRWTFLLIERYGNSLSGCGLITQPSNWLADTLPLSYCRPIASFRMKLWFEIMLLMKRTRCWSGMVWSSSVPSPDARQCHRPQYDPQEPDLPYVFSHSSLLLVSLTSCWTVEWLLWKPPCWVNIWRSTTGLSRNRRRSINFYGTQSEILSGTWDCPFVCLVLGRLWLSLFARSVGWRHD